MIPNKNEDCQLAQKLAEALALAQANRLKDKTSAVQEVYGVGIRHFFFEFWHALVPTEYMDKLQAGIELNSNEILVMHCYKGANKNLEDLGLDIRVPTERREIVRTFDAILRYLQSSNSLIGNWDR